MNNLSSKSDSAHLKCLKITPITPYIYWVANYSSWRSWPPWPGVNGMIKCQWSSNILIFVQANILWPPISVLPLKIVKMNHQTNFQVPKWSPSTISRTYKITRFLPRSVFCPPPPLLLCIYQVGTEDYSKVSTFFYLGINSLHASWRMKNSFVGGVNSLNGIFCKTCHYSWPGWGKI